MTYQRVIPRDLFNEAKLLKCLGMLSLRIHDGLVPCDIKMEESGEPFKIDLSDDGYLCVINYLISIKDTFCVFKTKYNSKESHPLYVEHEFCEYLVFDEKGEFDTEFIEFCNTL